VLAVSNPEAPERQVAVPEQPLLLDRIETALGFAVKPPEAYAFYYGLETDRGVLGERALNALYGAWRVKQLTAGVAAPRVLEIGAGLGRLAAYCHRMGVTDYWIVDVPLTSLAHGHFLAHSLGADRIVLDGEPNASARKDAVKILNPERFFADQFLKFDLVINVDSLTELGKDVATSYFRRAAERSPILFSVNHEVNPFRVFDLQNEPRLFDRVDRQPYWLRSGYVEEVFTRNPLRGLDAAFASGIVAEPPPTAQR
jgi:putative sugar O-methyltransferase